MNVNKSQQKAKVLQIISVALVVLAAILYLIIAKGGPSFWALGIAAVSAFLSNMLMPNQIANKSAKRLNIAIIAIPIVMLLAVVIFILILALAFSNSDWNF